MKITHTPSEELLDTRFWLFLAIKIFTIIAICLHLLQCHKTAFVFDILILFLSVVLFENKNDIKKDMISWEKIVTREGLNDFPELVRKKLYLIKIFQMKDWYKGVKNYFIIFFKDSDGVKYECKIITSNETLKELISGYGIIFKFKFDEDDEINIYFIENNLDVCIPIYKIESGSIIELNRSKVFKSEPEIKKDHEAWKKQQVSIIN